MHTIIGFGLVFLSTTSALAVETSPADIAALESQSAFREILQRAGDVAPSKRDAAWRAAVERAAIAVLAEAKPSEDDPLAAMRAADGYREQFPFLKNSKRFGTKRAEVGLAGYRLCYGTTCRGEREAWAKRVLDFAQTDAESVALGAGKLVMTFLVPEMAFPEFQLAVGEAKDGPACADADVANAVVAALETSNWTDGARKIASELCWARMQQRLVAAAEAGQGDFRKNACPFLLAKKVLTPAQAAKCK